MHFGCSGRTLIYAAALTAAVNAGAAAATDGRIFDGSSEEKHSIRALTRGAEAPEPGELTGVDDRYWVTIEASGPAARTRIASEGLSIEMVEGGTVSGIAGPETLRRIEAAGFKVVKKISLVGFGPEDFPPQDGIYHNAGEVEAELNSIAGSDPELISLFPIGQSVQGRAIKALRFHRKSADETPKPGVAFFGTHHAREHLSTETPLRIARWIADNRGRADVKRLLETRDIYFIPLVNPDGVEYDIATGSYRWQRKNMRSNGDGTTGVDLNRNYAFRWGGEGSSGDPGSDTYRGPSVFSEPESQAVRDFLAARPNIRILVSYHTFSELILYPWGGTDEPISDTRALAAFKAMAQKMAGWTGYRPMQSSELYVATGDTCDWAWQDLKMFCFTFELMPTSVWSGGFYPGAGAVETTVKKNIDPALYLIDLADDPYRAGTAQASAEPGSRAEPESAVAASERRSATAPKSPARAANPAARRKT